MGRERSVTAQQVDTASSSQCEGGCQPMVDPQKRRDSPAREHRDRVGHGGVGGQVIVEGATKNVGGEYSHSSHWWDGGLGKSAAGGITCLRLFN